MWWRCCVKNVVNPINIHKVHHKPSPPKKTWFRFIHFDGWDCNHRQMLVVYGIGLPTLSVFIVFLLRWCIKYYKDSQANMDELDVSTILNPPRTIISTWMSRSSIPTTQDLCFSPMSKQGKRHEHTIEMVITVGFCQPGRFQNRFSRCQPGRRWHHVTAGAWCFTGSNLSSNQLLLRESNPPPHHTFGSWGKKKQWPANIGFTKTGICQPLQNSKQQRTNMSVES